MKITECLVFSCVIAASGCAITRTINYYPEHILTPAEGKRFAHVLAHNGEPSLYVAEVPLRIKCRMTVLPSSSSVCFVTFFENGLGDVIQNTKIRVSGDSPASKTMDASGAKNIILFDDSRILSYGEWRTFLEHYGTLVSLMPWNLPPELLDVFAEPGGTEFILEGRFGDEYLMLPMRNPTKESFSKEGKVMLERDFPTIDVNGLEAYVQAYANLSEWFADQTQLSVFKPRLPSAPQRPTPPLVDDKVNE
jgi:hypothetical protein